MGTRAIFAALGVSLAITCSSVAVCPADVNSSGAVDTDDLIALVGGWGSCVGSCRQCLADIDDNCQVNTDDLIVLITSWGPCPCVADGIWVNDPAAEYSCIFGLVGFNITEWSFSTIQGTLIVEGAPVAMIGASVPCTNGQLFSVTGALPGDCDETYTLTGGFTSANTFTAVFTAAYTGECCVFGECCTTQFFTLTATRSP